MFRCFLAGRLKGNFSGGSDRKFRNSGELDVRDSAACKATSKKGPFVIVRVCVFLLFRTSATYASLVKQYLCQHG